MKVTFHDIGKTVDVPDGADESAIDDIHDSVLKDVTSGNVPAIENHNNILQRAAQAATQSFASLPGQGPDIPFGPGMQFGNEFKKNMFPGTMNNPNNPIASKAADYFTDPRNYIMALFGGNAAGEAANNAGTGIKNVLTSGSQLKNVEGQLAGVADEIGNLNAPKETSLGPLTEGEGTQLGKRVLGKAESSMIADGTPNTVTDTSYGPLSESQGTQLGQRALKKAQSSMTDEVKATQEPRQKSLLADYKNKKSDLAGQFNKATENEATAYKQAMEDAAAQNTPLYGQRLDELQSNLKDPITPDEYNQKVIQPALQEIAQKRLPLGGPEATIKSWEQKFSPSPSPDNNVQETDILGMPKQSQQAEQPSPLTLRGLNNIKNDIYNSQSYGSRMGSAKPDPSDVAANIFQKYHNNFMNTRIPGHAELQADAGPMIESTRNIYKSIRPGEEDLQPGMNMLQKAAKGMANPAKANPDIERDLGRVEQGYGGFEGTGNLRSQSTGLAKDMRDLDLKFTGDKADLLKQIDGKISEIQKSFAEDASLIKRGGMGDKENILQRSASDAARKEHISKSFEEDSATIDRAAREKESNMLQKQGQLEQRKAILLKSQADLKKLKTIREWAISGALGAVGWEGLATAKKKIFG